MPLVIINTDLFYYFEAILYFTEFGNFCVLTAWTKISSAFLTLE